MFQRCAASLLIAGLGLALAACAPKSAPKAAAAPAAARILLMGEVHDNPDGHRQRYEDLRREVEAGWRPAIVMEQFDRENQAALTSAQAECKDADCVIKAAGGERWEWPLYKPVIDMALEYRLPLIAANVSRADLRKLIAKDFSAALDADTMGQFKLDQPLPADLAKTQGQAIVDGHCGQFPQEMVPGMVNAQVARDVWMAKQLAAHSASGAVLIAGNGHVRKDVGVPRWLSGVSTITPVVHGYIEKAEPGEEASYDVVHLITPHERPDPCASMKMPGGN